MRGVTIRSLRMRMLAGTAIASALILSLLGIGVQAAVRRALYAEFDEGLNSSARALDSMVEQREQTVKFEFDPRDFPEFSKGPRYFELWVEGKAFSGSPSLEGRILGEKEGLDTWRAGASAIRLPDGKMGRVLVRPFEAHLEEDEPVTTPRLHAVVAVAWGTEELEATLSRLRWMLVGLCGAAVVVSGATMLVVVSRGLRPVQRMAREIEGLDETGLGTRLDPHGVPAELTGMVEKLNALLGRLEGAFGRERAFTADVAHELRTPIAGMRATLEVCRSRPRDEAAYQAAIDKSLVMITWMQGVVENLLLLARAEGGQLTAVKERTDLAEILQTAWMGFKARATAAGVTVAWEVPEHFEVKCDPQKVGIVVANLFDNAVSYVDPGGKIAVRLIAEGERAVIEVENSGGGVKPEEAERVFERFWRKDESRSATGVHAGLGLSLCKRLVGVWGGEISVRAGEGFLVRVTVG